MRQRIQILAIALGLLTLIACGSSTSTTKPAATDAPSGGASPAKLSISDPWARAAAMTGASTSGAANTGQTGTMTNTAAMSGTMPMSGTTTMSGTAAMSGTTTMTNTAAMSGGTSAAYLTITNSGGTADALIKAESDVANSVELHTMTMVDGVMKMTPVEKIEVPANGKAELKPGSFHVMLIGLRHDLKEGDVVKLTLTFQTSGKIEVEAPVRKP